MSAPVLSEMGYGQPVIYEAGGVRQLIIWHPRALNSLDPETGQVYGELPAPTRTAMSSPGTTGRSSVRGLPRRITGDQGPDPLEA